MKKAPKVFHSPAQRVEIESEIRSMEKMLRGGDDNRGDGVGYMSHTVSQIGNAGDLHREIASKKKLLKDGTPKKFKTTAEANKAYAWAKKAQKWIKDHVPNDAHVLYPTGKSKKGADHDFERSVQREMEWMKRGDKVVAQYKHIMQRLNPENPELRSIERLRR